MSAEREQTERGNKDRQKGPPSELSRDYREVLFEQLPSPVLVVSAANEQVADVNRTFLSYINRVRTDVLGRPFREFMRPCEPAIATGGDDEIWTAPEAQGSRRMRLRRVRCRYGTSECWLFLPVEEVAAFGSPHEPELDPLTKLPNRAYFDRCMSTALAGSVPFALLFLDLDGFKPVNDALGHTAGDQVLTAIAERLAAGIRPGDVLSRRGGDEFTLWLPGVSRGEEARHIAERLCRLASEPLNVNGRAISLGVSIGIVMANTGKNDAAALLEAADRAMYAAKRQGRPVLHGES